MSSASIKQGGVAEIVDAPVANGQVATFDSLGVYYESNYTSLVRQAMGMLRSKEAAHDAIQEAVTDTAQQIADGIEIHNIGAYLRVALRFRCLRVQCSKHQPLPLEAAMNEPTKRLSSPAEIAELNHACQTLYGAAGQLPNAEKSAFVMADVHGMDYNTIAKSLGRTEHAVRQLLWRARRRIRDAVTADLIPALVPIAGLRATARGFFGPRLRDLRDLLVAKLTGLQHVVATIVQRVPAGATAQPVELVVAGALLLTAVGGSPAPAVPAHSDGRQVTAIAPAPREVARSRHGDAGPLTVPGFPSLSSGGEIRPNAPGGSGNAPAQSRRPVTDGLLTTNAQNAAAPNGNRQTIDTNSLPLVPVDSPCGNGDGSCTPTGDVAQIGSISQVASGGEQPGGGGGQQGGLTPGGGSGGELGGNPGGSATGGGPPFGGGTGGGTQVSFGSS